MACAVSYTMISCTSCHVGAPYALISACEGCVDQGPQFDNRPMHFRRHSVKGCTGGGAYAT
eukprot:9481710-Pyramimonas_sp.AAC.1